MTSHLDSYKTTDIKPKCYQVSKPEMELYMINIVYAALLMCTQTEKTTFSKTTSAKLYIYDGMGARVLYIDAVHTALDIFCFAAFFSCGLLWYFIKNQGSI